MCACRGATNAGIILASASPRRAELLKRLGVSFRVVPSLVEEPPDEGAEPRQLALKRAGDKARAVAGRYPRDLVLAADTVVWCDGRILDKPEQIAEAREMLQFLSGRQHLVFTGVALRLEASDLRLDDVVATRVRFRSLSQGEIDGYLATGEPLGKAGGYGIQGYGALLVSGIEGCFYNVVGLPLARLGEMLKSFGVDLMCPFPNIT
jgi:septum formation protein